MGIRIGISGTHGIGKTTLCEKIAAEFGLQIVEEAVRRTSKWLGIESANEVPGSYIDIFQMSALFEQVYAEGICSDGFVSDRTVLDYLSYSYWRDCSEEVISSIEPFVYEHMKEYEVVVYCPIPKQNELINDGFRLTVDNSQDEIDFIMRNSLNAMKFGDTLSCTNLIYLGEDRDKWVDEVMEGI